MKNLLGFVMALLFVASSFAQNNLPIGVFDSGTGGLTVLEAILQLDAFNNETGQPGADGKKDFTQEQFQYLADQANMPYGNYAAANKTNFLREQVVKNLQFLLQKKYAISSNNAFTLSAVEKPTVKMMVVACNTATAYALADLKNYVATTSSTNIPVIGVINAGVKAALQHQQKKPGTVGVFATVGTVASNGYPRTLQEMAAQFKLDSISVVSQGGLGLAESIDRDLDYYSDTTTVVRNNYRGPSFYNKQFAIDTALLGVYNFNKEANKLLCEFDAASNNCLNMQLNDPENYTRYHLVSLLEKMLQQRYTQPLNTLILGCTHYPYMKNVIEKILQELYNYQQGETYRYRKVLSPQVALIDPAIETAKEAYMALWQQQIKNTNGNNSNSSFFICVPNKQLPEVQLQPDGWFTYAYKYGRTEGENKQYVQVIPFDTNYIAAATYNRFQQALPAVYALLQKQVKALTAK
jgi:glutamate racemase